MFEFVRRWQRYNRTVSELNHLSNRELADLGLTRSDIPRIAREAIRTDPLSAQFRACQRWRALLFCSAQQLIRLVPPCAILGQNIEIRSLS